MALLKNESRLNVYYLVLAVLWMYLISLHGEDIVGIRITCNTSNEDLNVPTALRTYMKSHITPLLVTFRDVQVYVFVP